MKNAFFNAILNVNLLYSPKDRIEGEPEVVNF